MWMFRHSIGLRLASVLGLLVVLMLVVSAAAWWGLHQIRSSAASFIDREFALTQTVANIRTSMARSRSFEKDVILAIGDAPSVANVKQLWDAEQAKLDLALKILGGHRVNDDHQHKVETIKENLGNYRARFVDLLIQIKQQALDNPMAAHRLLRSIDEPYAATQASLESMMQAISTASRSARNDMDAQQRLALVLGASLMSAATLIAWLSAFHLRKSIVRPLEYASEVTSRIAQGKLDVDIETDRLDEFGHMMKSVRQVVISLQERNERIEQEHHRAATLEQTVSASQAKSAFLAMMNHELRTPMAGVIGMLGLALKQEMPSSLRQQIEMARLHASALLNIVNDLIDLSQIEAGKMRLEKTVFELKALLEETMLWVREKAEKKKLMCKLHLDASLPALLQGDPHRIRQILNQMLGNALKFTEEGHIRLSVSPCQAPPEARQAHHSDAPIWLRFEVSDTGTGMTPDMLSRLFQKFEPGDSSTTRKFGGIGLGLSICQELVQLMGGRISVQSQLGKGSFFSFDIPLISEKSSCKSKPSALNPHTESLRVLVAEDSQTNWIIISHLLGLMGHQYTLAENGQQALQILAKDGPFDLVLMDGRMPIMDGLEATQHIRHGKWNDLCIPNAKIPIFGLTANADSHDREEFMGAGLDQFLSKPIDEELLHQALQSVIDKKRTLASQVTTEPANRPMPARSAPMAQGRSESRREHLIKMFFTQAPQLIREIQDLVLKNDWPGTAMKVHSLKGSVAYFWPHSKIFQMCAELEKLADTLQIEAFTELFKEMESELANAFAAYQENERLPAA